jgi:hypothetical protein
MFGQTVAAGLYVLRCGAAVKELDRLQRAGVMGWINVGGGQDQSDDAPARRTRLRESARRLAKRPAVLFWEGPDEALGISWSGKTDYVWVTEYPAMDAIVRGRQGAEADELRELRHCASYAQSRGLWVYVEKARLAFRHEAGVAPPRPDLRLDEVGQRVARTGKGLGAGIRTLREADPDYMIWLNHAPRNSLSALQM